MSGDEPHGELLLRTLAMPANTNANGDIFGGWVMSQMDMAGGILAKEVSRGRIVTIAADRMKFIEPVAVGDTVCCYGQVTNVGNTSIAIALEVWVNKSYAATDGESNRRKVTEDIFTYVAIDDEGKKRPIPKN
ncbi:MAG: acyl-CoA thioester hydrolase YciA [Kangiella sp.]|nr:acyl-CoA thioester hydrolase YciA [Kangiella sp.]